MCGGGVALKGIEEAGRAASGGGVARQGSLPTHTKADAHELEHRGAVPRQVGHNVVVHAQDGKDAKVARNQREEGHHRQGAPQEDEEVGLADVELFGGGGR